MAIAKRTRIEVRVKNTTIEKLHELAHRQEESVRGLAARLLDEAVHALYDPIDKAAKASQDKIQEKVLKEKEKQDKYSKTDKGKKERLKDNVRKAKSYISKINGKFGRTVIDITLEDAQHGTHFWDNYEDHSFWEHDCCSYLEKTYYAVLNEVWLTDLMTWDIMCEIGDWTQAKYEELTG